MPDPAIVTDGGVQAQLAQISMELGKQSVQLAVIGTKLDTVLTDTSDHEGRIRALEKFRWTLMGGVITISAGFSALGTWIGFLVTHH